jgi:hypothetical protein
MIYQGFHHLPAGESIFGAFDQSHEDLDAINYVDDCAFLIFAFSQDAVLDQLIQITCLSVDVFASFLLRCVFSAKKIALMLVSKSHKRPKKVLIDELGKYVSVSMKSHPQARVPVIDSYVHLGKVIQCRSGHKMDVAKHIRMCDSTVSRLRPQVFADPAVPTNLKKLFAEGCALSRLFTNVCVWDNLSQETLLKVETSYNKAMRNAYGEAYSEPTNLVPISDKEFYIKYNLPNVKAVMKVSRLRLLARVLNLAPPLLKHMLSSTIEHDGGIAFSMMGDLQKLWRNVPHLNDEKPDPRSDGAGPVWAELIASQPLKFRQWATDHALEELLPLVKAELPVAPIVHACPFCKECFSFQALGTHMFRAHGVKNAVRQLVSGTVCCACLKQYNTRSKLLHHVSFRAKNCKQYYQNVMPPMPAKEFEKAEAETALCRKNLKANGRSPLYNPLPVIRVQGPLPAPELFAPLPATLVL